MTNDVQMPEGDKPKGKMDQAKDMGQEAAERAKSGDMPDEMKDAPEKGKSLFEKAKDKLTGH